MEISLLSRAFKIVKDAALVIAVGATRRTT